MKTAHGKQPAAALLLLTITLLGVSASSQAPGMTSAASRVTVERAALEGGSTFHKQHSKDKYDQRLPGSRLA